MKNLVIVESPAKAKTISKFLGSDYVVMASMGHVRDLPKSTLGFDPDDNFKPNYQVSADKKKVIADLKKQISKDTTIYLAADEDREGEAIAWHLIPALKIEKNPIKRIVFHEITKDAILKALQNPRDVDQNLVDAQQARRILDRAVGYELSPLLWKKVRYGLSAGRVQSVAVKIIVDRENEIRAFVPEEYWKIKADFINPELSSELAKKDGKNIKVKNEKEARDIENSLNSGSYKLVDIEEKESTRNPAPPFTTSTLQQEASRKIGLSVAQTMMIAQQLYEGNVANLPNHTGGLITYMRTDSLNLSTVATTAAKKVIEDEYGSDSIILYTLIKEPENLAEYVKYEDGKIVGDLATFFEIAVELEGAIRNESRHASAIIISNRPIYEIAPLVKDSEGNLICAFDMYSFELAGLVKFDILGLRALDGLAEVNRALKEIDPETLI